jgi:hypothetical protein
MHTKQIIYFGVEEVSHLVLHNNFTSKHSFYMRSALLRL